jgi:transposase
VEERCALWAQLEAHPDAKLEEHRGLWEQERGVRVSVATMSRAIRRFLGWTYKQRRWEPPSETSKRGALGASG